MADKGNSAYLLLVAALLAVSVADVHGHASSRLRGIIGTDGPGNSKTRAIPLSLIEESGTIIPRAGDLACPKGKTLQVGTGDAAQNPTCVPCGSMHQFACNGSTCKKGLKVLNNRAAVQPICIRDDKFRPLKAKLTARGKNRAKGGSATVSITKDVGCGIAGWCCCANKTCYLGTVCDGATCLPDRKA